MWGPDLTIRALYITHTLKGGMEERGQKRSGHTHTHAQMHKCILRDKFNTHSQKAGVHGGWIYCKYKHTGG